MHDSNLADRSIAQGEKELADLKAYCEKEFGVTELAPWDISFYSEKQNTILWINSLAC
ncbi:MAG: M3 family metallopeptidase [Prevotella denticola]